ncbi:Hsp70 family protein [Wenxinia marina]|uniref:Molecular chaperone n=1 Tax=Wenxinia marina DSM 24838 TaxID=1123501 RepID=A0A0D0QEL3_9RHOB|nr:Hsp70 family protein [Wenxinia marina]KIQ70772.1 Molecular chaperone [Wenxinia marina DSM 24838]GGL80280.1 molecular chaperone DnaK [Wenxinia marina]
MPRALGVDFGTSNTSAAWADAGIPRLIELEPGRTSIPTAVFLDFGSGEMLFGEAAVAALVEGREGRFLRALKRVLGSALMRERRQLLNRRMTLVELVGEVLALVKARAEAATGERFDAVLAGRPVRFQEDPARDAQAAVDLGEAYRLAGFSSVDWLAEPEAAALAAGVEDGVGLVVDVGGGTSDFTLFRAQGGVPRTILSRGVRVGGTDADRAVSLSRVMPRLGYGGLLRAELGSDLHAAPQAPFQDMATWEKIGFLQTPQMAREAARWVRLADRPELFERFRTLLDNQLGFDVAFAVEAGKIAANGGAATVDLGELEPGLSVPLDAGDLNRDLAPLADRVVEAAAETLAAAGTDPAEVTHIVYVGGSSLLGAIRTRIEALCPAAQPIETAAFTAVAEGLARATA